MKNLIVTLTVTLAMILTPASSLSFAADDGTALTPGNDDALVSRIIDSLSGGDGLYLDGINGFDIYDHLGYVYLGWRTTGGSWQNHIVGEYIPQELKSAGYKTTDEEVEAPYGGTYSVTVKVKASGNENYKSETKTVTIRVRIR